MNKMLEYELVSRMLKETCIARNHQLFNAMSLCHREKWTGSSSHIQTCTGEREAQNETPFISSTDMCSIAHTLAEKLIKYTTLCCYLIGQIRKSNHST
jgi:hypothetical protein